MSCKDLKEKRYIKTENLCCNRPGHLTYQPDFIFFQGDRLCKVEEYKVLICNFAKIMGMDPSNVLASVHPSLLTGANEQQKKNISDDILNKLNTMVQQLKEEKDHRLEKV